MDGKIIKSLSLQNFQSHKHTKLNFSPGVNVIVGSSDSGKSSIIRALRWLVWNRPQGTAFCSRWGGTSRVILRLKSNIEIIRIRNKNINTYLSIIPNKEREYKALKTDVPEPIQKLLNINLINLQQQHDIPFLLSNSPGEVAQHFNQVAHLDVIDHALQNVQQGLRSLERQIDSKKLQLEETKEQLKQYDYLDELEGQVVALEAGESNLRQLIKRQKEIKDLIQSVFSIREKTKSYSCVLKTESKVNSCLHLIQEKNQLESKKISLASIMYRLQSIAKRTLILESELIDLTQQFKTNFPEVCPLCGQRVKKNK